MHRGMLRQRPGLRVYSVSWSLSDTRGYTGGTQGGYTEQQYNNPTSFISLLF